MVYGIKKAWKHLIGKGVAGRNLEVYADDTFIVSYPRSGNTWTRFLIANLLYPDDPATFANIEHLVPDAEAQSDRHLEHARRPRFVKSHEYFDHRYPRVIYIVRDPRDVALSYYDFHRKYRHIGDDYPLERFISDFVNGRLISADWGTWGENVGSWIGTRRNTKNFLLLRYEDMIADTAGELFRIATFLQVNTSTKFLEQVIERSSAKRMRELEKLQANEWVSTKEKRPDIPFIGKASAGGWRKNLPTPSVVEIELAWDHLMSMLGYELVATEPPRVASSASHFYRR